MTAAALLSLASCGKQSPTVEEKPIEVKVMTVQKSDVSTGQSFSGTIEEENGSALSFPNCRYREISDCGSGTKSGTWTINSHT